MMGVSREERQRGRRVRRALLACVALIAASVAWLAAPALSLGPYFPTPVDFELRDPPLTLERTVKVASRDASRSGRRRVIVAGVLDAPKRFNLLGLRWRGGEVAALSVRVRRDGGRWGHWTAVPVEPEHAPDPGRGEGRRGWINSDPVWAGEADQAEVRLASARPPRDVRAHFVNTKGTATTLDRLRSGLRRAAHGTLAAAATLVGARADAQVGPDIVTRAQWGASACPPRATPAYGEVKLAFVHHTVTANEYGPEDSAAMVLGICRYHRNSNHWNDIGYQFLVDRYGRVFEGRAGGIDQAVVGAQAQGYNSVSTAVSSLGTFSTVGQTEEGLGGLARILSWKLGAHGIPPQGKVVVRSAGGSVNRYPAGTEVTFERISGHRDGDATSCPGDGLYSQLPRLRGMIAPDPRAPVRITLSAERASIQYGRKARLTGGLVAGDGAPLGGRRVGIDALGAAGASSALTQLTTDGRGSFATNVRLAFNRRLQASFGGEIGLRAGRSRSVTIGVRPLLTATLRSPIGGRGRRRDRAVVTGSVRPRKRTVLLIVDRRTGAGGWRRIAKLPVRARFGRVRATYRLARSGGYRLRLGVDRDARNLSARSEPLTVAVD